MRLYVIIILIAMLILTSCSQDLAGEVSTAYTDLLSYEKTDFQLEHNKELDDYCRLASGDRLHGIKSISNSKMYCISVSEDKKFKGIYPAKINEMNCGNTLYITSIIYAEGIEQHGARFNYVLANGYFYNPNSNECETCGNLIMSDELGEECDDGNLVDGDGCSSKCEIEDYDDFPYETQTELREVYGDYCKDLQGNWVSGIRTLSGEDAQKVWCGNDKGDHTVFRIKEINCKDTKAISTHKVVFYHKSDPNDYDIRDDIFINKGTFFNYNTGQCEYCGEGTVTAGEECDPPDGKTCNIYCEAVGNPCQGKDFGVSVTHPEYKLCKEGESINSVPLQGLCFENTFYPLSENDIEEKLDINLVEDYFYSSIYNKCEPLIDGKLPRFIEEIFEDCESPCCNTNEQFTLSNFVCYEENGEIKFTKQKIKCEDGKKIYMHTPAENYKFINFNCVDTTDTDGDGTYDSADNCPLIANKNQLDTDNDGKGDECDPAECGNGYKEEKEECDDGNLVDNDGCSSKCIVETATIDLDADNDGILDENDNCVNVANPNQEDTDNDGVGDACETDDQDNDLMDTPDTDGDGIYDINDNCVNTPNIDQEDYDEDGIGNACDTAECGNDILEEGEECDGIDDLACVGYCKEDCTCEGNDQDNDGVLDSKDICPGSTGEVNEYGCDENQVDSDNDGVSDANDKCENTPLVETANLEGCSDSQIDLDNDGYAKSEDCDDNNAQINPGMNEIKNNAIDDDCDPTTPDTDIPVDTDGDGLYDHEDNCINNYNPDQEDSDNDGKGDVCDTQICGNNIVEVNEECDDGNLISNDGCSNKCKTEDSTVPRIRDETSSSSSRTYSDDDYDDDYDDSSADYYSKRECDDNEDNDGDGLIDMEDPDCSSRFDNFEGEHNIWDFREVPEVCDNNRLDSGETDVDCGGSCPPCNLNMKCDVDTDCNSRNCEDGICKEERCVESWVCNAWSLCQGGFQTRECFDDNDCGSFVYKPTENRACQEEIVYNEEYEETYEETYEEPYEESPEIYGEFESDYIDPYELCFNGVWDEGEEGIDCGGLCPPCDAPEEKSSSFWIIGLIALLGIVGAGAIGYAFYEREKSKIKLDQEKEEGQDLDTHRNLRDYIKGMMEEGHHEDHIKKRLMGEGWKSNIVDKALKGAKQTTESVEKAPNGKLAIKKYIKQMLDRGYDSDQITNACVSSGWNPDDIEKMMDDIKVEEMQQKMQIQK